MQNRSVVLKGIDKELPLGKVAMVKLESSENEFIYLERMKNSDKWRLTFTEKTIPEIQDLEAIEIKRD